MSDKLLPFKIRYDFEERKQQFDKHQISRPKMIPVIVQPCAGSKMPAFKNSRFCLHSDRNILYLQLQLLDKLRQNFTGQLDPNLGFCLYVSNKLLSDNQMNIKSLYEKQKDKDGFLYINYSQMEVF